MSLSGRAFEALAFLARLPVHDLFDLLGQFEILRRDALGRMRHQPHLDPGIRSGDVGVVPSRLGQMADGVDHHQRALPARRLVCAPDPAVLAASRPEGCSVSQALTSASPSLVRVLCSSCPRSCFGRQLGAIEPTYATTASLCWPSLQGFQTLESEAPASCRSACDRSGAPAPGLSRPQRIAWPPLRQHRTCRRQPADDAWSCAAPRPIRPRGRKATGFCGCSGATRGKQRHGYAIDSRSRRSRRMRASARERSLRSPSVRPSRSSKGTNSDALWPRAAGRTRRALRHRACGLHRRRLHRRWRTR